MKRINLFAAAMLMLCAASCEKNEPVNEPTTPEGSVITTEPEWDKDTVVIHFSPYRMSAMTRAAQPISTFCNHLDVWISEGANVIDIHQTSADADFGTITAVLDKTKTYTIQAVAHKCDADATLADGVISFPDDKVTHSMVYNNTFTPSTTTSLSAEMQRIVAQFKLETTDAIPDEAKKMRFTISDVYNRWNVSTGATNKLDRASEVNISSKRTDGTVVFSVYAIVSDDETMHTVTVSALDADDAVLQTRVFTGVTLRNGYKTSYRGAFFIDTDFTSTFTVADWSEYDTVDF